MEAILPTESEGKNYWDASYKATQHPLWSGSHVPYAQQALEKFNETGVMRLLDVPSGDGRNFALFCKHLPFVVGLDSSATALQNLQLRIEAIAHAHTLLVKGDILELPFPKGEFCGVFCWDLLGHLEDPKRALLELLRVCKNGGLIIGSLFAMEDDNRGVEMTRLSGEKYLYKEKFFFRFYEQHEVVSLLQDAGLVPQEIERVSWWEPPHAGYREYEHQHSSWVFTCCKP